MDFSAGTQVSHPRPSRLSGAAPSLGSLLGAVFAAAFAVGPPGCSGDAPSRCQTIHGTQQAVVVQGSCKSPVGLCTEGTLAGTGIIDGTTSLVTQKIASSAGLGTDEPPTTVSYTGMLTITAPQGVLSLHETGLFDTGFPGGIFVSRDVIVSGTGTSTGMTGYLIFEGSGTTHFDNTISGEICQP